MSKNNNYITLFADPEVKTDEDDAPPVKPTLKL